jgi:dienelactone hydrolase
VRTEGAKRKLELRAPVFTAVFVGLLFFGALFWAKGRDPFQRKWFAVRAQGGGKAECIAVIAKSGRQPPATSHQPAASSLSVVVYLHGANETALRNGNELRQMAEMGLAVVGLEYNQTNEAGCDAEFTALLDYLGRQKWADTNRMAWVGLGLGAERVMEFAGKHPEQAPAAVVCLSGGLLGRSEIPSPKSETNPKPEIQSQKQGAGNAERKFEIGRSSVSNPQPKASGLQPPACLFVHGEQDSLVAGSEAQRVADRLRTNGVAVELRVLPGQSSDLGANRLQVFRAVGEYCLTKLNGPDALVRYESILKWQKRGWPLWVFWLPAGAWVLFWWWWQRTARITETRSQESEGLTEVEGNEVGSTGNVFLRSLRLLLFNSGMFDVALRWVAGVLAVAAVSVTALHLVPPRLAVGERTLSIARKHIVQPKERADFEVLAAQPLWQGKKLGILLEHVELANYNRELIDWTLEDAVYRDYVLSPEIDPQRDGDLNWRRPLWENFYPRIRKEQTTESAAEIVVRFLRERVTIVRDFHRVPSISEAWQSQLTDPHGFNCLYVAAMRSAGIPARLDAQARPEFWTGTAWQTAPRPVIESCGIQLSAPNTEGPEPRSGRRRADLERE